MVAILESNMLAGRQDSKTARLAAALFFFLCVPLSLWDQFYVPRKIFVAQDSVATANNLLSNEFIFRTSIVIHLTGFLIFVMMVLLFHRIFRPVDKHQSAFEKTECYHGSKPGRGVNFESAHHVGKNHKLTVLHFIR